MSDTIRAKFVQAPKGHEAKSLDTPLCGTGSLVAYEVNPATGKRELVECITVRTHFNPKGSGMQPVRANVWIKAPRGSGADWLSGRGSAGGCGYHKESAALADAVDSCGVELYGSAYVFSREPVDFKKRVYFGGTGSSAYADIFKAIAKARGFRGPMLWVSHGL